MPSSPTPIVADDKADMVMWRLKQLIGKNSCAFGFADEADPAAAVSEANAILDRTTQQAEGA